FTSTVTYDDWVLVEPWPAIIEFSPGPDEPQLRSAQTSTTETIDCHHPVGEQIDRAGPRGLERHALAAHQVRRDVLELAGLLDLRRAAGDGRERSVLLDRCPGRTIPVLD